MLIFNPFLLENRFRPREKIAASHTSRSSDFRGVPLNSSWLIDEAARHDGAQHIKPAILSFLMPEI